MRTAPLTVIDMVAGQALDFIHRNPGAVTAQIEGGVPLTEYYAMRAVARLRNEERIAWSKELSGWVAVEPEGGE